MPRGEEKRTEFYFIIFFLPIPLAFLLWKKSYLKSARELLCRPSRGKRVSHHSLSLWQVKRMWEFPYSVRDCSQYRELIIHRNNIRKQEVNAFHNTLQSKYVFSFSPRPAESLMLPPHAFDLFLYSPGCVIASWTEYFYQCKKRKYAIIFNSHI